MSEPCTETVDAERDGSPSKSASDMISNPNNSAEEYQKEVENVGNERQSKIDEDEIRSVNMEKIAAEKSPQDSDASLQYTRKSNFMNLIDSESSEKPSDNETNGASSAVERPKKLTKRRQKKSARPDSTERRNICDSSSSSSSENEENPQNETGNKSQSTKTQRLSAKQALGNMKLIMSEGQRMERDTNVKAPYHRPQQLTIQKFLKWCGTTESSKSTNPKMNSHDLENYAELIKKRALKAKQLFELNIETETPTEQQPRENEVHSADSPQISPAIEAIEASEAMIETAIEADSETTTLNVDINSEPSTSLVHKQRKWLIDDCIASLSPTLKGNAEDIVDLESGEIRPAQAGGVETLFKKYFMNASLSRNIESTQRANSHIGTLVESKNKGSIEDKDAKKEESQGTLYKVKLAEEIARKRKEKLLTRLENKAKISENSENCDSEGESEFNSEDFDDDENEASLGEEALEDASLSNIEDEEAIEAKEPVVKKSRIIRAFDESDEDEKDTDQPIDDKPSKPDEKRMMLDLDLDIANCSGGLSVDPDPKRALFQPTNNEYDENDLMALCSGTFKSQNLTGVLQQTLACPSKDAKEIKEPQLMTICSSDDEEEGADNANPDKAIVLKSKATAKHNKINYSDEESQEDAEEDVEKDAEKDTEQDLEENAGENAGENAEENKMYHSEAESDDEEEDHVHNNKAVYYDSEENSVEEPVAAKQSRPNISEFVENEAELSESEWGSADENEEDLDKLDIELGDDDEFDSKKLHRDLERIHMRRMLDQDAREVKIIENILFDTDANEGKERDRQFRWKNQNEAIHLGGQKAIDENEADQLDDDYVNEEEWRRLRHEREMLLKEKAEQIDGNPSEILTETKETELSSSITIRKSIHIVRGTKNGLDASTSVQSSSFLISENVEFLNKNRTSFLRRDDETLSKLAIITKIADNEQAAGVKLNDGKKASNFTFATLSQPPLPVKIDKKRRPGFSHTDFKATKKQKTK